MLGVIPLNLALFDPLREAQLNGLSEGLFQILTGRFFKGIKSDLAKVS